MKRIATISVFLTLIFAGLASAQDRSYTPRDIHQDCFRLGAAAAFAEMVRFGVKKLALGTPLSPQEMRGLEDELRRTIVEQGVQAYLETDLIVTDLFPEGIAEGKHLMLSYTGDTLDEYLALKRKKQELEKAGNYSGKARLDIAREFGRLLSYPESTIEERIK